MPLSAGQTFAGYRIVRLLGSGGMGEVYLAEHPRLPRRDALKVLPADVSADADYRARFNREADLASKLYHPHIVGVHDRGEQGSQRRLEPVCRASGLAASLANGRGRVRLPGAVV
jgi:serine/threonine-protein kinase